VLVLERKRIEVEYGTVKFFSKMKGWGFIQPDASEPDIFVHWTELLDGEPGKRNLTTGQRVQFTRKIHPVTKKEMAAKVAVVREDENACGRKAGAE